MGRSAAARREKRQMKRDVAKSTRTTKYANQKGGGVQKPRHRARPLPSRERAAADDDGESIAVIRGGKAVWARADGNIGRADAAVDVTGMGEERDDDDSAVKKLRALRKKLRRVQELRQRRGRGEELNGHQMELLRKEPDLRREIDAFAGEVERAQDSGDDDEDGESVWAHGPDVKQTEPLSEPLSTGSDGATSDSRIQQRRALKKQRHLQRLALKQQRL